MNRRGGLAMPEDVAAWGRAVLVDEAVDHAAVAEAASQGTLEAMEVVLARCEAFGVGDVTLAEVVRSWATIMG